MSQKILVVSSTANSGKTTVATNIAAASSTLGDRVGLASALGNTASRIWSEKRPAGLPSVLDVRLNEMGPEKCSSSILESLDTLVIDLRYEDFQKWVAFSNTVIIPVTPDCITNGDAMNFLARVLTHKSVQYSDKKISVVLNKSGPLEAIDGRFKHFLDCIEARPRFSISALTNYKAALETGKAIFEFGQDAASQTEKFVWERLVRSSRKPLPQKTKPMPVQSKRGVRTPPTFKAKDGHQFREVS